MNDTLRQLARDLDHHNIAYSVMEAVALNQHGYQRFTHDIDLLITREGLEKFTKADKQTLAPDREPHSDL